MKKINLYEVAKILLLISFLATIFLAALSLTIFQNNGLIINLHKLSGIIFSVLAIFHIITFSKKKKR